MTEHEREQLAAAVARRVVELLQSEGDVPSPARGRAGERHLTAAQIAERFHVHVSWVYAHKDALGAIRIGKGARPRLRFDPEVVAARIGEEGGDRQADRPRDAPEVSNPSDAMLLPIRG